MLRLALLVSGFLANSRADAPRSTSKTRENSSSRWVLRLDRGQLAGLPRQKAVEISLCVRNNPLIVEP
jgi:hypothetical protein